MNNKIILCSYGCNKEAKFFVTKLLKPCCSERYQLCSERKKQMSESIKKVHIKGKYRNNTFNIGKYLQNLKLTNPEKYNNIRKNQSNSFKKNHKSGLHKSYSHKHSEETKEKLRQKRIEYLKLKTGQSAWERRSSGKMSYLEQWFYDEVILKEFLEKQHDIVNEYCESPYFLDFAFVNEKITVELDGACHFINNKRIEHDIKRDEYLKSLGRKIFRIAYNDNKEEMKRIFLDFLSGIPVQIKTLENRVVKFKEIKSNKSRKKKVETEKSEYEINLKNKIERNKQLILTNLKSLRLNQIGKTKRISELTGISHSHVLKFIKTHLPDLLKNLNLRKSSSESHSI